MGRIEGKAPDGKGGINEQSVDTEGRARTRSIIADDFHHALENGTGYIFHSTYSATGGEEVWSLQNDGIDVHVNRIVISTSASGVFSIMRKTSGTPAGTTMEGRNGVLGRPIMPDVTAFGSASVTGSVDGDVIDAQDIGTSAPYTFDLDGLVVPLKECLFVRAATTGIVYVTGYVHRGE
jgi:hypothetical protein|tara:strand:- start:1097 stop:1633 length:537 start_codon:yes stop_codon:yes gene_type:complete